VTLFGKITMGKFPEQFAGSLVVGAGGIFFDRVIAKRNSPSAPLNGHFPFLVAGIPTNAFVLGRARHPHFPHSVMVLLVGTDPQVCPRVVKPVKILVVNMGFPVRNTHDETVQENRAFAFIPSSSVNSAAMDKGVPLERIDPFVVLVIDHCHVSFCESNFFHNPNIITQLTSLSRGAA
jgi:hypothetical protein